MPSRITNFLHDSLVIPGSPPTLGTSFTTANVHVHDMALALPPYKGAGRFSGIVEGIHVRVTGISGATKLTVKVCLDSNLDITLVPDTEATIALGTTTANSGCVAFSVGIPLFQILGGNTLYLAVKTDAGSAVLAQSCITWRE